jgi:hypothetical protein
MELRDVALTGQRVFILCVVRLEYVCGVRVSVCSYGVDSSSDLTRCDIRSLMGWTVLPPFSDRTLVLTVPHPTTRPLERLCKM